jgi:glycosyltransferase involved in cell wall biosynthesis
MKISIIIPVYDEEEKIKSCVDALLNQISPKRDYEIIIVNDGSKDNTGKIAESIKTDAHKKNVSLTVFNLEKNCGRLLAREFGAKHSKYDYLLFIDARCVADKNLLKTIKTLDYQPLIGNALIPRNTPMERFNYLIRKKIYPSGFGDHFKPTLINQKNFDRVGKGTGVFFCEKKLFLEAQPSEKGKNCSDDTKLLKNISLKRDILKHPDAKVTYSPRSSLINEIKHTFERGPKFIDYYLDPKKKKFWLILIIPQIIFLMMIALVLIQYLSPLYFLGIYVLMDLVLSIYISEKPKDLILIAAIFPALAVSFELGILMGFLQKVRKNTYGRQ